MRCPIQVVMSELCSYEELQSTVSSVLDNTRVFDFCMFDSVNANEDVVLHPDILSNDPLLGPDTQLVINIPDTTSEPCVSNYIQEPTWKDILNLLNDTLIYMGFDKTSGLRLQGLELIGITQTGFGHYVHAIISKRI